LRVIFLELDSKAEKEIFEMVVSYGRLKVYSNVKAVDGWKDALNSLMEKGLVEKEPGNVFVATEKADDLEFKFVDCEDCGRSGKKASDIPYSMWCSHDNISVRIDEFT